MPKPNLLDNETFATIVANTPLVSIDLIIRDENGNILLGLRKNEPAKGYWFVPGGRILKDERIAEAFTRIGLEELGVKITMEQADLLGIYEHFYENNVYNKNFTTHYVVLGFELTLPKVGNAMKKQHEQFQWFDRKTLMQSPDVHRYTKDYFIEKGLR